jgi:hypothetical protein
MFSEVNYCINSRGKEIGKKPINSFQSGDFGTRLSQAAGDKFFLCSWKFSGNHRQRRLPLRTYHGSASRRRGLCTSILKPGAHHETRSLRQCEFLSCAPDFAIAVPRAKIGRPSCTSSLTFPASDWRKALSSSHEVVTYSAHGGACAPSHAVARTHPACRDDLGWFHSVRGGPPTCVNVHSTSV